MGCFYQNMNEWSYICTVCAWCSVQFIFYIISKGVNYLRESLKEVSDL